MANFRPRRGKRATAIRKDILLKHGEIFFEVPIAGVGTGPGHIVMGDGKTAYEDLPYYTQSILNSDNSASNNIKPDNTTINIDGGIISAKVGVANGVAGLDDNSKVPDDQLPIATTSDLGIIKPDGETILVDEDGTIHGASSIEVINNLTSTSTTNALSANMGRELKSLVDNKLNKVNPTATGYFVLNPGTHQSDEFGLYSTTEGEGSLAEAEGSHAEGIATLAQGDASHSEGQSSKAEGKCSHAEGGATIAAGDFSHTEGNSTVTNNLYEHAEGHFNKSHKASNTYGNAGNTIHSIGVGTNLQSKKNAVEVMQNGDMYVLGVGGYDGEDIENAMTIEDIVNSKSDTTHVHDDRYYTESEIDTKLANKVNTTDIATTSKLGIVKPDGTTVAVNANGVLSCIGGGGGGFIISDTTPTETDKLWIDTGNGGVLKYYYNDTWNTVKSVWG